MRCAGHVIRIVVVGQELVSCPSERRQTSCRPTTRQVADELPPYGLPPVLIRHPRGTSRILHGCRAPQRLERGLVPRKDTKRETGSRALVGITRARTPSATASRRPG